MPAQVLVNERDEPRGRPGGDEGVNGALPLLMKFARGSTYPSCHDCVYDVVLAARTDEEYDKHFVVIGLLAEIEIARAEESSPIREPCCSVNERICKGGWLRRALLCAYSIAKNNLLFQKLFTPMTATTTKLI